MPIQIYRCPVHGEFELRLSFKDEIPGEAQCPVAAHDDCKRTPPSGCHCNEPSPHVLKPPAAIIVEGGTGAGQGRR